MSRPVTATITFELEVTVEATRDQWGFDIVDVRAVTGYDGAKRVHTMTPSSLPTDLAELISHQFVPDAESAISAAFADENRSDDLVDLAYERSREGGF